MHFNFTHIYLIHDFLFFAIVPKLFQTFFKIQLSLFYSFPFNFLKMCIYLPKELYPYHKSIEDRIAIFLILAIESSATSFIQLMHFHNKMLHLHLNLSFIFGLHNHGSSLENLILIFFYLNQVSWIFLTKDKAFSLAQNFLDWITIRFLSMLFSFIQIFIPTYLFQSTLFQYLSSFPPLFLVLYSLYLHNIW